MDMLGFAAKSGKCVFGTDVVITCVKKGSVKLVLVDDHASANTKKKLAEACALHRVEMAEVAGVGRQAGKEHVMAVGVKSADFAKAIKMQD